MFLFHLTTCIFVRAICLLITSEHFLFRAVRLSSADFNNIAYRTYIFHAFCIPNSSPIFYAFCISNCSVFCYSSNTAGLSSICLVFHTVRLFSMHFESYTLCLYSTLCLVQYVCLPCFLYPKLFCRAKTIVPRRGAYRNAKCRSLLLFYHVFYSSDRTFC